MAGDRTVAFRQGLIVTQDKERRVLRGDLILRGQRVEAVGVRLREGADEEVDARGFLLAPGLINAHTHVANALLRGLADDLDFPHFLERMFAVDARRVEKDIELGALLGGAEMLLSGTTSFLDLYYGEDAVARACGRLGIRGFFGWAVLDPDKTTQKGVPVENARGF
ncbi:amidohydrolase, partial [mine drainage metagenome]